MGINDDTKIPMLPKHSASKRGNRWSGLKYPVIVFVLIVSLGLLSYSLTRSGSKVHFLEFQGGDLRKRCNETFFTQTLNHFEATDKTYQQRYFICAEFWKPKDGPIFFYLGNEADVELYLNHTGLMWENAQEFGAMLVFAEHRYFGKSIPFGEKVAEHMEHLSSEQALADYAVLIADIKQQYNALKSAVIGFGGSYGGMLATWLRLKYPHVVDGVIAGSAPVLAFSGQTPPLDAESFARIVTYDATPAAGSSENCVPNIRLAFKEIQSAAKTDQGRAQLADAFGFCDRFSTEDQALSLIGWIQGAFTEMAMGNYPYASSYIMNGDSELPVFPVRKACSYLHKEYAGNYTDSVDVDLLRAVRNSVNVYYNNTLNTPCYSLDPPEASTSTANVNYWDYLWCSELYMPFDQDGVQDMFLPAMHNETEDSARCMEMWGVKPRLTWANTVYGGIQSIAQSSNIVFSNGKYDPWSGTGVLTSLSDSVVAVSIEEGAHHLDLMFSNEMDPQCVKDARMEEKKHIRKWIHQVKTDSL